MGCRGACLSTLGTGLPVPVLRTLVLTAVSGRRGAELNVDLHRAAGRLPHRIHVSRPSRPGGEAAWAPWCVDLTPSSPGVKGSSPRMRSTSPGDGRVAYATLPPQRWVPCHGYYQTHNWLVDEDGVVRAIDFADSRWHTSAFDLTSLCFGPWWNSPHLAEAFLHGYVRPLEGPELEFINPHLATNAVIAIRWGRLHGVSHIERRGRERLAELMAGHRFAVRESTLQRTVRRLREIRSD